MDSQPDPTVAQQPPSMTTDPISVSVQIQQFITQPNQHVIQLQSVVTPPIREYPLRIIKLSPPSVANMVQQSDNLTPDQPILASFPTLRFLALSIGSTICQCGFTYIISQV
jgi:hypothetical protein